MTLVGWVVSGVGVIWGAGWWPALAKGSAVVSIVAMPTVSEDRRRGLG